MRAVVAMLAACGLMACSGESAGTKDAAAPSPAASASTPAETVTANEGDPFALDNPDETPACQAGLQARGVKRNEMWVMIGHTPDGVCPNVGVDEARIREIVGFWSEAGCRRHTPEEMLAALNNGRCGGDAG